ncbi:FG-GAP-like repeat-containing protein [Deinococcus sp.]|uniref:FG-GAP-like repeat-containing protein n=1 Tax=Deinococcus sp. TaxID=47478 RepID=UPI003B59F3D7
MPINHHRFKRLLLIMVASVTGLLLWACGVPPSTHAAPKAELTLTPQIVAGFADSDVHTVKIFKDGQYICTGAILGGQWILTARHCVNQDGRNGQAPESAFRFSVISARDGFGRLPQENPVNNVYTHPIYDAALLDVGTSRQGGGVLGYRSYYGRGEVSSGIGVTSHAWGPTSIGGSGGLGLRTGYHRVVRPGTSGAVNSATGPAIGYMEMTNSFNGRVAPGDSGGSVTRGNIVCGVISGGFASTFFAVKTEAIADWIFSTTFIPPRSSTPCNDPDEEPRTNQTIAEMPLGASITQGVAPGIPEGNDVGYRPELMEGIEYHGVAARSLKSAAVGQLGVTDRGLTSGKVDFVGRKKNGSGDPDHEGYPGFRVDQIAGVAKCAVPYFRPNMVTIVAGTNDVIQNFGLDQAPNRMGQLVDQVFADSSKVLVLVQGIPPLTDPAHPEYNSRADTYNQGVAEVLSQRVAEGKHVLFLPSPVLAEEISSDHIHPTPAGYSHIAEMFIDGAAEAIELGWLQAPDGRGTLPPGCPLGTDQGKDKDSRWEDHGVSFPRGFSQNSSFRFGDVNQDGKPEFWVVDQNQGWQFFWNGGRTDKAWTGWPQGVKRAPRKSGLVGNAMRLADLDGDRHADCVTIDLNGRLPFVGFWDESKPVGQKLCGRQGKLNWDVPKTGKIDPSTRIVFADINGDKKDDYILVNKNGGSSIWLNTFVLGSTKDLWQKVNPLDPSLNFLPPGWIANWADINGDGRADQINVNPKGGATAWLNVGGARRASASSTSPYLPVEICKIGVIMQDKGLPPQDMKFVDIGGDGKADLVRVGWTGVMHIWLNRLNPPYARTPLAWKCPATPNGSGANVATVTAPEDVLSAQTTSASESTGDAPSDGSSLEASQPLPDDPLSPYNPFNTDLNITQDQGSDGYQGGTLDVPNNGVDESSDKGFNPNAD